MDKFIKIILDMGYTQNDIFLGDLKKVNSFIKGNDRIVVTKFLPYKDEHAYTFRITEGMITETYSNPNLFLQFCRDKKIQCLCS